MSPTVWLIPRRIGMGVATLWIVSAVVFFSVYLLPGDLAEEILGQARTPETVANIRRELHLDRPPAERYVGWMVGALQGDFGRSLASDVPISELIGVRLANTLFLAVYSAAIAVPLSLSLGIVAALRRGQAADRSISVLALTAISLPEFFTAYILIFAFAVSLEVLPSLATVSVDTSLAERFYKTTLPALTLTLAVAAHMIRLTRASIVNVMASPYIEMARLKGLTPVRIMLVHAVPNALAPIINVVVLNLAYLVVGVVVVEVVFAYPGLGQLIVDAVAKRDIPVVQATSLIFAAVYISLNLIADVLTTALNPRLRHQR
ncbi:MAG: ABC transporter permease [Proteobacteria bacterium]|nr:ABC transporter permease [Pseudomonadota bacterium]